MPELTRFVKGVWQNSLNCLYAEGLYSKINTALGGRLLKNPAFLWLFPENSCHNILDNSDFGKLLDFFVKKSPNLNELTHISKAGIIEASEERAAFFERE